jgi:hypothetical protein
MDTQINFLYGEIDMNDFFISLIREIQCASSDIYTFYTLFISQTGIIDTRDLKMQMCYINFLLVI